MVQKLAKLANNKTKQPRWSYDTNFKIMAIHRAEPSDNWQASWNMLLRNVTYANEDHLKKNSIPWFPREAAFKRRTGGCVSMWPKNVVKASPITRAVVQMKASEIAEELNTPSTKLVVMQHNGLVFSVPTVWLQREASVFFGDMCLIKREKKNTHTSWIKC